MTTHKGVVESDQRHSTQPAEAETASPATPAWRSAAQTFLRKRELALLPVIAICIVIGAFISNRFLTVDNLVNVLQQSDELALLVIAESLILICGKFDLSLESTFGLAPMVGCWAVVGAKSTDHNMSPYLGIVIIFAVGAAIGAFNGLLIVRYKMNAFIVTLAMLIVLRGLVELTTNDQTLYSLPEPIVYLGSAVWWGIPVSVFLVAVIFLAATWFMRSHATGRAMYAIGGNEKAARAAGIPTRKVMFFVFVLGSVLAALAGLIDSGRLASVANTQGQNMIFTTMAAAVIGGISLNGGRGSMLGAMTGVFLLTIVQNLLTFAQVPSFWIDTTYGAVILFALALARITSGEVEE